MCRTDTFSMSLCARRNTEPEVFTFDQIPARPAPECARPRRRRVARVLYPSTGRRYLPRAERSAAKRWLLALCLVVLLQIYTEDDVTAEDPFAAESARREDGQEAARAPAAAWGWWPRGDTCPASETPKQARPCWDSEASARSGGYVVALLYPVYHKLGSEQ